MKQNNLLFLYLCIVCVYGIQQTYVYGMCGTTVLWHNLSDGPSGLNPGVTADVIDQNIDVEGTNALVDGIHVQALNCDILVTITNGDSVITGSGNRADGVPTNPARLYMYAAAGHTITWRLDYDLLFKRYRKWANIA